MTDGAENTDDLKRIADEARDQFDLANVVGESNSGSRVRAGLQGRGLRSDTITLYTDAEAGKELGNADEAEQRNALGLVVGKLTIREGVLGKIADLVNSPDDLTDNQKAELAKLETQRKKLKATLDKSALVLSLRSVPTIVTERIERETRAALKIPTGELIPTEQATNWRQISDAKLLAALVTHYSDKGTGDELDSIDFEDAKALREFLPRPEYNRLLALANDLQFKNIVAESVTKQADF